MLYETIKDIETMTQTVDGFLSQNGKNLREGEVLFHLARHCPKGGQIAEIGSWKGKSTIWLGKGAEFSDSQIYAIDHHIGSREHRKGGKEVWTFDVFKENISSAKLDHRVTPILKKSKDALDDVKEELDLLFIDGAHEYEAVKEDLFLWKSKMKKGGIIAFHDSFRGWEGVKKVVHRHVFCSPQFSKVRYIDSITYAVFTEKATFWERLKNRLSLVVKIIHEKTVHFPQPFKSFVKHLVWLPCRKRWLRDFMQ